MVEGLELRTGYFADRPSFLALAGLLQDTFDIDIGLLDRFGGPDLTAMPCGYFDADGRCVANFSAFSMPMSVDGRPIRAVGYQSGAVRPEYRGQGLYRDLMRRAFDWAQAEGFEAGILLTDKPDLYRPYGFETVSQHCFSGALPERTGSAEARRLSLEDADDLALVTDILDQRCEVSRHFAACLQTKTFLLNICFDADIRISHLAGIEAIAAWKEEGDTLRLLDVVAAEMPTLGKIVSALGSEAKMLEVLFPPDLLGWDGTTTPYRGSCELMVRPSPATAVSAYPFMLAPTMEF